MSFDAALNSLSFPGPGPRPLLTQDEMDLLVAKADLAAEHGKGFSRRRLSLEGKKLCRALAEEEQDDKERERLANASCGKNWRKRVVSMTGDTFNTNHSRSLPIYQSAGLRPKTEPRQVKCFVASEPCTPSTVRVAYLKVKN